VKVIVDTNIIFSAVLNSNSTIARLLIGGRRHFKFYSCEFLRKELLKHRSKLLKLTKLSVDELDEVIEKVTGNITFINESLLPAKLILDTEKRMAGNDLKDVPFVALAKNRKAKLWTGDKALAKGLARSHPQMVVTTLTLLVHVQELEG
jgi:predicted nucleic acid-binding protein